MATIGAGRSRALGGGGGIGARATTARSGTDRLRKTRDLPAGPKAAAGPDPALRLAFALQVLTCCLLTGRFFFLRLCC